MTERFMIDDAGTLIDMNTRNTYDYVTDVVTLLNELNDKKNTFLQIIHNYQDGIGKLEFQLDECKNKKLFSRRELEKENKQLKEALKNTYWNEICENCKHGKYERNWYGEGEFECLKKHFGNEDWKCDGLKECDEFELDLKRFLDD